MARTQLSDTGRPATWKIGDGDDLTILQAFRLARQAERVGRSLTSGRVGAAEIELLGVLVASATGVLTVGAIGCRIESRAVELTIRACAMWQLVKVDVPRSNGKRNPDGYGPATVRITPAGRELYGRITELLRDPQR